MYAVQSINGTTVLVYNMNYLFHELLNCSFIAGKGRVGAKYCVDLNAYKLNLTSL